MGDISPKTSKIVLTQMVGISQRQSALVCKDVLDASAIHDDQSSVNGVISNGSKQPQAVGFSKTSNVSNDRNHVTQLHEVTDLIDFSGPDVSEWVQRQEMVGGNAVENIESRFKQIEFINKMESNVVDNATDPIQPMHNHNPASGRHIHSMAFSDDSKTTNNMMYKTPRCVKIGEETRRNKSFGDQTDVELNKLKSELQRQDLEIHKLRDDLKHLKSIENEEDRSMIADKFVDKVNTIRMPSIISGYERLYDVSPSKPESNNGFGVHKVLGENFNGIVYKCGDNQDGQDSSYGSPRRELSSKGFVSALKDKMTTRRMGMEIGLTTVPDMDSSRSISMMQFQLNSLLSTLELSIEKLCNNFWMRGPRDSDSSMTDSGSIEDELFVLTKTVYKLKDLYQEFAYSFFNYETAKERIINSQKQLAQAEFRISTLESLCIQKDRTVDELECQMHSILKELEGIRQEKYELSSVVQKLYKEAEEQRYRMKELLGINEELLQFSQAKEEKLGSLQIAKDHLTQQVVQYQEKTTRLELLLKQKEKDGEELKRRLKAGQIATEGIIFEKIELSSKLQEMQKEVEEQRRRINELISINEELLEISQIKEDQSRALQLHVEGSEKQASNGVEAIDKDNGISIKHEAVKSEDDSSNSTALLTTVHNPCEEHSELNLLLDQL